MQLLVEEDIYRQLASATFADLETHTRMLATDSEALLQKVMCAIPCGWPECGSVTQALYITCLK